MRTVAAIFLLLVAGFGAGSGDRRADDRIAKLPGAPTLRSAHFSGYLDAGEERSLFYWFVESERKPAADPLIIWFAGGPGCSSLESLLAENGPFFTNDDGSLRENEERWTKFASIVYLNTPDFTSFSYSANRTQTDPNRYTDHTTAEANYAAIKSFLQIHPSFRQNELFLFGVSFGGLYVSVLSAKLLEDEDINLKGIGIGNGVLDEDEDLVQIPTFLFHHGILEKQQFEAIFEKCGTIKEGGNESRECLHDEAGELRDQIALINTYNILQPCDKNARAIHVSPHADSHWESCTRSIIMNPLFPEEAEETWRVWHELEVIYKQDVRSAQSYLEAAIEKGVRVLLFYGDMDAVCPFLTAQIVADSIGKERKERRAWPNGTEHRVYGFLSSYERLAFATILGAGHNAVQDKPKETAWLVQAFLDDRLDSSD